ncbi:MAG: hypothetical protein JSV20_07655, partial [Candidatus Bathyarchaeota archaeon]
FEYTSTTIDNLIKSLEEAIKTEAFVELEQKLTPVLPAPPVIHEFDQFMIDIENRIEELFQKILGYVKKEKRITLSKLTFGLKKFEAIRIFLLVLFIASKEKIRIWQEEAFGEIFISLPLGIMNSNAT